MIKANVVINNLHEPARIRKSKNEDVQICNITNGLRQGKLDLSTLLSQDMKVKSVQVY